MDEQVVVTFTGWNLLQFFVIPLWMADGVEMPLPLSGFVGVGL
jgi:hypothetical protein